MQATVRPTTILTIHMSGYAFLHVVPIGLGYISSHPLPAPHADPLLPILMTIVSEITAYPILFHCITLHCVAYHFENGKHKKTVENHAIVIMICNYLRTS